MGGSTPGHSQEMITWVQSQGLRDGGMGRQDSDRHPVVTGPGALANLTSSSRQIASIQHFPCEALWPASCSGLRPPVSRKSPAPLGDNSPTGIGRGRAIWQRGLKGNRAAHLQKPLSQTWGGGREGSSRSCNSALLPRPQEETSCKVAARPGGGEGAC